MPEGDTLSTLAGLLAPELDGSQPQRIEILDRHRRLELTEPGIHSVTALGKNLLLALTDKRVLRVHLGLYGDWHRYATGEAWRRPSRQARLILRLPAAVHVCFNARRVELLQQSGEVREVLGRLGPDLTATAPDLSESVRRARSLQPAEAPLVDLLLDQRIAAGIGNVYKCEVLFLARLHPATATADVTDAKLAETFALAARLLRANAGRARRDTRGLDDGQAHLWVYGRAGRPCLQCGTRIRQARLGRDLRPTWWCETCQPASPPKAGN